MKTSACRDGTLKNRPNKMGTTLQHNHTIPTSCAILPIMHNTKFSTLNEHGTQHYSLHSLPHKRQSISATFSSNKISQHKIKTPTGPALLTVSAYHSFYIPAMLSSNYIASTHNISMHINMHALHTQQYLPTNCLPQSSYAHN